MWCGRKSTGTGLKPTVLIRTQTFWTSAFSSENYLFSSVSQSCLTLWNPMDCSSPGSSLPGILQARILEWVAMPCYREFSRPRNRTLISSSLMHWQASSLPLAPTWEALSYLRRTIPLQMPYLSLIATAASPMSWTVHRHTRQPNQTLYLFLMFLLLNSTPILPLSQVRNP